MNYSFNRHMAAFALTLAIPLAALAHSGHGHHTHQHPGQSDVGNADNVIPPEGVAVSDCWIRALPNGMPSAAYFTLHNSGPHDAVLVNVQSNAFGKTMLHANKTVDGMVVMVHADNVKVPAGGSFEFAPGGHHVMLEQPVAELVVGKNLPIIWLFEAGRALTGDCEVRSPGSLK